LCNVAAMEDEVYCEEVLLEPQLWSLNIQHDPVLRLHSAWIQPPVPLKIMMFRVGQIHRHKSPKSQWTLPSRLQQRVVHTLIGGPRGKMTETPHINDGSMPFSVFSVYTYFTETVTLLVVESTRYYQWCKDSLDVGPSPKPDLIPKCLCFWQ
jgi:hypothetical protein